MVVEDVLWADDATPGRGPLPRLAHPGPAERAAADLPGRRAARRPSAAPGPGRPASRDVRRCPGRCCPAPTRSWPAPTAPTPARCWRPRPQSLLRDRGAVQPRGRGAGHGQDAVLARLGGLSEPTQRPWSCSRPSRAGRALAGGGAARRRHDGAGRGRAPRRAGGRPSGTSGSATKALALLVVERRRSSTARVAGNRRIVLAELARRPGGRAVAAVPPRPPGRRPRGGRPPRPGRRPRGGRRRRLHRGPGPLRAGAALVGPAAGHPAGDRAGGERLGPTTSPASTRRWPAPARWSPCASGPATWPRSGRPSPPCRDALHGERPVPVPSRP